ncbi:hypothetical protein BCR44DRAFT_362226 [Catenaria anguillulae PL171]|uniref:Uncharacterized protein n=1 Tax=Catenaria anguillulae PL171 TaxID=765915 RepID=A0A1Y2HJB9_9FUNG|nr:hypothetical protein BCR44DRAFT_362226 [Catenaria anguillulae PL171]
MLTASVAFLLVSPLAIAFFSFALLYSSCCLFFFPRFSSFFSCLCPHLDPTFVFVWSFALWSVHRLLLCARLPPALCIPFFFPGLAPRPSCFFVLTILFLL